MPDCLSTYLRVSLALQDTYDLLDSKAVDGEGAREAQLDGSNVWGSCADTRYLVLCSIDIQGSMFEEVTFLVSCISIWRHCIPFSRFFKLSSFHKPRQSTKEI